MIIKWLDWLLEWLIERFGGLELLQLFLLGFTLECVSLGLTGVIARLSFGFMPILVIISVLTAWALTHTRLPNWGFGLIGSLLGLFELGLTAGRIGHALIVLLSSFFPVLGQLLQEKPVDLTVVGASWQALGGSLTMLVARFGNWFRGVSAHRLVIDPMVTSILWGMALWLAVFWAFWWVRRRANGLVGLLPAVALLGYNVFYTNSKIGITWLLFTAGGILMLQACTGYGTAYQRWATHKVEQVDIEPRLAFMVVLLAGGMMLAGGILPSVPIHRIADAIDKVFHPVVDQSLVKSLGLEQTPIGGYFEATPIIKSGINSSQFHPINSGPVLDLKEIMFVDVNGYNPPPINEYSNVISQLSVHYYWRAQTYDTYNGHNWIAHTAHVEDLAASQSIREDVNIANLPVDYTLVTQQVTRLQVTDKTVFAAGELLSLDQYSTMFRGDNGEIISTYTEANQYTAVSRILSPGVEQLRAAGSNYPPSVRQYLELPDELPVRVRDLALNLTADQPTPYDRAAVLETYLRQFPYSLKVPGLPSDRDAVDYFLFDLKKGYCDYFASAMVVMARAAGLPARLVLGYSEGIYDQVQGHFVVRSSNAHAWAEIYFPDIGWVEFEPTSIQTLPLRPGLNLESSQAVNLPPPGQEASLSIHLERTRLGRFILALLGVATVFIIILFLPMETWWLSLLSTDQALKTIFDRLYRRGGLFGILPNSSRTSNEFALALSSALERYIIDKKYVTLIAGLRIDLDRLTSLYNRLLFSEQLLQKDEKQEAILAWAHFHRGTRQVRRRK